MLTRSRKRSIMLNEEYPSMSAWRLRQVEDDDSADGFGQDFQRRGLRAEPRWRSPHLAGRADPLLHAPGWMEKSSRDQDRPRAGVRSYNISRIVNIRAVDEPAQA